MQLKKIITIALFSINLCGVSLNAYASNAYAQLSSLKEQIAGEPRLITMEIPDLMQNIEIGDTKDKLVIKTAGTYFVMAAAQVGAADPSLETISSGINLWLVKNGKALANTNTKQTINFSQGTSVLVSQTLIQLKPGDTIGAAFAGNNSIMLVALPATHSQPAIPSIIFTLYMI